MAKLLFLLKKREMTLEENNALTSVIRPNFKYCISSGLRNSARFVVDMLNKEKIETKMVEVADNNCIDREVTAYKPTHVIIEAFWVVPEKFDILQKLHPNVLWIIRNHSEMPFLANEGIAIDWSLKYLQKQNVFLAPNSKRAFQDTIKMATSAYGRTVSENKVLYLPNYYDIPKTDLAYRRQIGDTLDVGCFGAIRPLKNQLMQAIAAIAFAEKHRKKLNFHINVARLEDKGNAVLNSIRGLFSNLNKEKFNLIEHGWLSHEDFLELVGTMDIGLQVSFTESFNIVSADFVVKGVPLVSSKEISWLPDSHWAVETEVDDIVKAMDRVLYGFRSFGKAKAALRGLTDYNKKSVKIWKSMFGS